MNKLCVRCRYPAQFNWSGLDVCGMGCYEILMLQQSTSKLNLELSLQKMLGESVQGVADTLGNIIKSEEHVKIPAATYSRYYPASETWVIELNKYHRDNLIWLFNAIGYPYGQGVEPFKLANTGDWVGEIPLMLRKPEQGQPVLDDKDRPNVSLKDLEGAIDSWIISKKLVESKK